LAGPSVTSVTRPVIARVARQRVIGPVLNCKQV
jgi:hypothetical protein